MPICNLTCLNLPRFPCAEEGVISAHTKPLLPLHTETLRVAIVAENFLPKIDSSTLTIARLLQYFSSSSIGPESEYAGTQLSGTFGIPLRVYPCLKINFISPALVAALRAFAQE
ncbi:hypothetical protein C8R46DRAFT_1321736 [Mycena filopes]|nr:hypothetical protein C8R46DRAFT_1321736 [Mycena filopes]